MSSTTIEIIRNKIINYFEDYFKENNLGKADEKTVQLIACFSNEPETNFMFFGVITPRGKDHQMFEVRFFSDTGNISVFIYGKSKTETISV